MKFLWCVIILITSLYLDVIYFVNCSYSEAFFFHRCVKLGKSSRTCPFTVKLHVINLKFIYKTKAVRDLLAPKTTTQLARNFPFFH